MYVVAGGCFIAGVAFTVIPILPGTLITYTGLLAYAFHDGFETISIGACIVLGVLALVGMFIDDALNLLGARVFGASWAGLLGVLVGLVVGGILLFPVGLFIGPFAGAFVAEMIHGRSQREALNAGLGALLGCFVGMVAKLAVCTVIIGWFLFSVILR